MAFLNPLVSPDSAYAYRQGISRIPLLVYTPGTGPSTPFSLSSQPSETGLKASLLWSTIPLTPKPSPFGVSRRFRFLNKTCVILGLLISLLWLALGSGRSRISFEFRMTVEKDELEGLQWIDAHHPDIRVCLCLLLLYLLSRADNSSMSAVGPRHPTEHAKRGHFRASTSISPSMAAARCFSL